MAIPIFMPKIKANLKQQLNVIMEVFIEKTSLMISLNKLKSGQFNQWGGVIASYQDKPSPLVTLNLFQGLFSK